MTIARFPVPPIVKRVTVRAAPARAFALFAGDFARCRESIPAPIRSTVRSSRGSAGGCSNVQPMGTRRPGEPCWHMTRRIDSRFPGSSNCRRGREQLVEIRFTPEDRGTTVELTHSGWEQLGDAAASLRERYDRGWGTVFERHFVDYANSAAT